MSSDSIPATGQTKLGRRKNANTGTNAGFSAAKVSREDLGSFQDGVFQLPTTTTSTSSTTHSAPRQPRKNKPMSKSAPNAGTQANIITKPQRSGKSSSGKHLSFAPESTLVQIRHFPPTSSPTTYSSIAEDSAASTASTAAPKAHWAGGAYANSPDPTSIPLPTFAPKPAPTTPSTSAPSYAAQASVDLRRLLNIPTAVSAQPLHATA